MTLDCDNCVRPLTDEEINSIAERAADRAVQKITSHIYQEIGKSIVSKMIWIVGVCSVGLFLWLQNKGIGIKSL